MVFILDGRQKELVEQIKALDPEASILWGSVERLEKQLEALELKVLGKVTEKP
jgi:phage shock protein A